MGAPRPWGLPRRTTSTVASAGGDHERTAMLQAAMRMRQQKARDDRQKAQLLREQQIQQQAERNREAARKKLADAMARQRAARQKLQDAQAARRKLDGPGSMRNGLVHTPDEAFARATHDKAIEDARHELHQARQANRRQRDAVNEQTTKAAGDDFHHDKVADQRAARRQTTEAERTERAQTEAAAKAWEAHGYQPVYAPGDKNGQQNAKHGKIVGVVDKYGAQTVITPEELAQGQVNWNDPSALNAVTYDPHNPNGTKFVDQQGRQGNWVNTGTGKKQNWEYHPYTYDDYLHGANDSSGRTPQLKAFAGQGPLFVKDEGETWVEQPHLGAFGLPEGGTKVKGTYQTYGEKLAEIAGYEKSDPQKLKDLQQRLFDAGFYSGAGKGSALTPGSDAAPLTGLFDDATNTAVRQWLQTGSMEGALTHDDLDTFLTHEAASMQAQFQAGGGGGGGAAQSWSATDPAALHMYAESAARAVLGRNPTEQEIGAAVSQVTASETAEGQKSSGAIVNVDPQARMVEYFRNEAPAEFGAKNIADAMGMFAKMMGEGGLLGSGMAASGIGQGNGSGA